MPKATETPTTSRRAVFRGLGLTSIVAGLAARSALAAPAPAAAPPDTHAELIRLCDRLVQLRTHEIAVIKLIDDDDDDYDTPAGCVSPAGITILQTGAPTLGCAYLLLEVYLEAWVRTGESHFEFA